MMPDELRALREQALDDLDTALNLFDDLLLALRYTNHPDNVAHLPLHTALWELGKARQVIDRNHRHAVRSGLYA